MEGTNRLSMLHVDLLEPHELCQEHDYDSSRFTRRQPTTSSHQGWPARAHVEEYVTPDWSLLITIRCTGAVTTVCKSVCLRETSSPRLPTMEAIQPCESHRSSTCLIFCVANVRGKTSLPPVQMKIRVHNSLGLAGSKGTMTA